MPAHSRFPYSLFPVFLFFVFGCMPVNRSNLHNLLWLNPCRHTVTVAVPQYPCIPVKPAGLLPLPMRDHMILNPVVHLARQHSAQQQV